MPTNVPALSAATTGDVSRARAGFPSKDIPDFGPRRPPLALSLTADARRMLCARYGLGSGEAEVAALLRPLGADGLAFQDCCWNEYARNAAAELLERLHSGARLPLLVRSCPEWERKIALEKPELLAYFSSATPDWRRQGEVARAFFSASRGTLPGNVAHVTVVGCPARKAALLRAAAAAPLCSGPEYVLTAREVALWLERVSPDARESARDAARESACRTFSAPRPSPCAKGERGSRLRDVLIQAMRLAGDCAPSPDFARLSPSRLPGVQEGRVSLCGQTLTIYSACGVQSAYALLSLARSGAVPCHLAEVVTCAGNCGGR